MSCGRELFTKKASAHVAFKFNDINICIKLDTWRSRWVCLGKIIRLNVEAWQGLYEHHI